ncbi:integrin alpha-7 [Falco cherrug]|uniref:integrin alpha-7 n=1 Tax=Falco cherrug TaxID=345164 RepID=UPI002478E95B|nr:integrin alpha-7 [Falco cherrug]
MPCCTMLCHAVPCHPAWPCPASPSRFLPSAASSRGAPGSPATPLTITGPAWACSPRRRSSRRWRASGNGAEPAQPRGQRARLGFFRRARSAPPAVPQYHAVKIPREERQQFREEKTGTIQRKEWAANPRPASDGHLTPSSA